MANVQFAEGMSYEQEAVAALENLLKASKATMALWKKHGLGDDENESEPVYRQFEVAITDARLVLSR